MIDVINDIIGEANTNEEVEDEGTDEGLVNCLRRSRLSYTQVVLGCLP